MFIVVMVMSCNIISDIACIEVLLSIIIRISNIEYIISFMYIGIIIIVNVVMFLITTSLGKL